jgi:hypothetical protein
MIGLGIALLVVLAVVLTILLYLLFAPFYLEIDSEEGLFQVRLHRLAKANITLSNDGLMAEVAVFKWQKRLDLLAPKATKEPEVLATEQPKKKPKSASMKMGGKKVLKKIWAVVQSFKITKCFITFDMDDVVANGQWYGAFWLFSQITGKTILINFEGNEVVILKIENNIARMLWAYLKT